ncbi:MAG: hypothetical protein MGU50_10680 [Trichodesmium sp. MAG_R02]|nr:hypothetical protein [Trichodesmium sp. MAG_R02]
MVYFLGVHCPLKIYYSASQIDELHRHNQSLVGTLHKGVPTVVDQHIELKKNHRI